MLSRRKFLATTSAATALALLPSIPAWAKSNAKKITILHTNDQHSRIEPFETSENPKYSNKGGFARRAALIDKIRKEEPNVLLLDAGDIFQGTPYFNFLEANWSLNSCLKWDMKPPPWEITILTMAWLDLRNN